MDNENKGAIMLTIPAAALKSLPTLVKKCLGVNTEPATSEIVSEPEPKTVVPVEDKTLIKYVKDKGFVINGTLVDSKSNPRDIDVNDPFIDRVKNSMNAEYGELIKAYEDSHFTTLPELLINSKEADIVDLDEIPANGFFGSTVMHSRHSAYEASYPIGVPEPRDAETIKALLMTNFHNIAVNMLTDMIITISKAYTGLVNRHVGQTPAQTTTTPQSTIFKGRINISIYPYGIPVIDYLSNLTTYVYDEKTKSIGISQNSIDTYASVIMNYCERSFLTDFNRDLNSFFYNDDVTKSTIFVNVTSDVSFLRGEFDRFVFSTLLELVAIAKIHIASIEEFLHEPAPQKSTMKKAPFRIVTTCDCF